jgi:hypothetical protein
LSRFCQRQRTGAAAKQGYPQVIFQHFYLMADCGWRDIQFFSRLLKTQMSSRNLKGMQSVEWGQRSHKILDEFFSS